MKVEIRIDGELFPCYPTMGAMVRFKQETGREVSSIEENSLTDACMYLWCCVKSASRREGKKFDMTFMDFADSINLEDMQGWMSDLLSKAQEEARSKSDDKEKKTSL